MTAKKEPALLYGVLTAALALAVAYGFISSEKLGLWQALVVALLPLLQALFTRREVMPVSTINDAGLTTNTVQGMAEDPAVTPVHEDGTLRSA